MRVASDLGGVAGYGPVEPEPDEPVFHHRWEARTLGLTLAMGATRSWTLDRSRFVREDRPLAEYVGIRYYDLWLRALERLLVEGGLVAPEELASGVVSTPASAVATRLAASDVDRVLRAGSPVQRQSARPARFALGDTVTTSTADRPGHTRLPAYTRGRRGVISAIHGCHVYPDSNAHGLGEDPQWLYTVEFSSQELFGAHADPLGIVSIDAFEPYLEAS